MKPRGPNTKVISDDEIEFNKERFHRYTFEGIKTKYFVSKSGNVYSEHKDDLISQGWSKDGYRTISMYITGRKPKLMRVNRMVAGTFISNPENKPFVNHIDGVKYHNNSNNLEWVTNSENMIHAFAIGLEVQKKGGESPVAKYTNDKIHEACKLFMEGKNVLKVSSLTGISETYLRQILSGDYRGDVSSLYNFPSSKFSHRPTVKVPPEEVYKIYDLVYEGYTNKEIQEIMGYEKYIKSM